MADDTTLEFSRKSYKFNLASATSPCLVVVEGPETGAIFSLREGTTVLGRCEEQADIVLLEPGISRTHARFTVKRGKISVVDLDSTNGLHLNGEFTEACELKPGDSLTLSPGASLRVSTQDEQVRNIMAELYRKATLDGATGVLTKESFFSRLEVKNEACLSLVDVDHLDRATDRHGHLAGEALLMQLASTLKSGLAEKGFVGRLGGETFIVFLKCRALDADEVLEGVRKGIEYSNFRVDTEQGPQFLRATVSIGVADLKSVDEVKTCISAAEQALLGAKQMGRNRINIAR